MNRKSVLVGVAITLAAGTLMAVELPGGWKEVVEPNGCMTLSCSAYTDAGTIAVTANGSSTEIGVGYSYRVTSSAAVYLGNGTAADGGVQPVSTSGIFVPESSPEQITFGNSGGNGLQNGQSLRCYMPSGTATVNICRIYSAPR